MSKFRASSKCKTIIRHSYEEKTGLILKQVCGLISSCYLTSTASLVDVDKKVKNFSTLLCFWHNSFFVVFNGNNLVAL